LRGIAGERHLGDHIGIGANVQQRRFYRGITTHRSHCRRTGLEFPGVGLVNIHAHVQSGVIPEKHQWRAESPALGVLTRARFHLEDAAGNGGANGAEFDLALNLLALGFGRCNLGIDLVGLSFCRFDLRPDLADLCLSRDNHRFINSNIEPPVGHLFDADGHSGFQALANLQPVLRFCRCSLRLVHFGACR